MPRGESDAPGQRDAQLLAQMVAKRAGRMCEIKQKRELKSEFDCVWAVFRVSSMFQFIPTVCLSYESQPIFILNNGNEHQFLERFESNLSSRAKPKFTSVPKQSRNQYSAERENAVPAILVGKSQFDLPFIHDPFLPASCRWVIFIYIL